MKLVPYDAEIKKLIEESSYVLALISNASLSTRGYLAIEWAYAMEKEKRVLPFLLDRSVESNPDAPAILKGVREINWVRAYESFEEGEKKVLQQVTAIWPGERFAIRSRRSDPTTKVGVSMDGRWTTTMPVTRIASRSGRKSRPAFLHRSRYVSRPFLLHWAVGLVSRTRES